MKTTAPLILASGSPRRQHLLRELGIDFDVLVREVVEDFPPGLSPGLAAEHLAKLKCAAFDDKIENHVVITADTVVALKGQILGKPKDRGEAVRMLRLLSGNVNQVITAVCIRHQAFETVFHVSTMVSFRELTDSEIDHYVSTSKPYDKAGGYGIQEWIGMIGIDKIDGDYYNVVGLPLARLWQALSNYIIG